MELPVAVGIRDARAVPDGPHPFPARGHGRSHHGPAGAIDLDAGLAHDRRRLDAACPHDGARPDPRTVAEDHAVLAHLGERGTQVELEATLPELAFRVVAHGGLLLGEDAVLELDDVERDLVRADLLVEAAPDAAHEVLDLAGGLDSAEPGAAHHERELRAPLLGILLEVGALEHLDDPVAERERIGQRLHADRVVGDALDPERGCLAAEGHHQGVVAEPMRIAVAAGDGDPLRVEVDAGDVTGHRPAGRPAQLRAECRDTVPGLELPRADLGQERREEREVLAADDPDLDVVPSPRQPLEMARGLDPGEATTDDEHAVRPGRFGTVDRPHSLPMMPCAARGIGGYHRHEMQPPIHEIFDQFKQQLPDIDPDETQEWIDSLEDIVEAGGPDRARFIIYKLLKRARQLQVGLPALTQTRYINTISPEQEPYFPGDEEMELRVRRMIRWNALAMVLRANTRFEGIGGHLSTYASAASLYEVGFNHFFRGADDGAGDQVFFQGHAAPGIYARAFLEGRLSEQNLEHFRRESLTPGLGLSSYPHPRLMPDFWQFPTVSMGLGPMAAVYQARFNRYLAARGIADTTRSRVWAFLGDGEMDEPEAQGALGLAAREGLDNLTFVVNCNLQRLDGPVRGNGKIIQELEAVYRGAGWNVIKVIWAREWDDLLARDKNGVLLNKMNETLDGDYQRMAVSDGAYIREQFFGPEPRLRALVEHLTDDDLAKLRRGGHDYRKVYAAYAAAVAHKGAPTVILAKTVKGWALGPGIEGRNVTHQAKKLTVDELKIFRDRLELPIPDEKLKEAPYYHPGPDAPEIRYMLERRSQLGGALPRRRYVVQAAPSSRCRGLRGVLRGIRSTREHDHGLEPAGAEPRARPRHRQARGSRSSPTRRAPSAWTRSSRRSGSTTRWARTTRRSTRSSCSPTSRRPTGSCSRRASPRPARSARSRRPARATRPGPSR